MLPKEIIEDLCSHSGQEYCTLREILKKRGHSPPEVNCTRCDGECEIKTHFANLPILAFYVEQFKCIEIFKWEESERAGHDIGWGAASRLWVDDGYAAGFRAVYRESMKHQELYEKTMQRS